MNSTAASRSPMEWLSQPRFVGGSCSFRFRRRRSPIMPPRYDGALQMPIANRIAANGRNSAKKRCISIHPRQRSEAWSAPPSFIPQRLHRIHPGPATRWNHAGDEGDNSQNGRDHDRDFRRTSPAVRSHAGHQDSRGRKRPLASQTLLLTPQHQTCFSPGGNGCSPRDSGKTG